VATHSPRRWYRLSLRTALLAITLLSAGLGWYRYRAEKWREVERIKAAFPQDNPRFGVYDYVCGWMADPKSDYRWAWAALALPQIGRADLECQDRADLSPEMRDVVRLAGGLGVYGRAFDDDTISTCSTSLQFLHLQDSRVTPACIEHIQQCRRLRILGTDAPALAQPILESVSAWPQLEELVLSVQPRTLTGVLSPGCSAARTVFLKIEFEWKSPDGKAQDFRWLAAFQHTKSLSVSKNGPLEEAFLRKLAECCPTLEPLEFRRATLPAAGMGRTAELPKLDRLLLHDCHVKDESLIALKNCPRLNTLGLYSQEGRTEESIQSLQSITRIPTIEYTPIGDTVPRTLHLDP
jgi:hypothetical protein